MHFLTLTDRPKVEYTVILIFPGFGEERENAEGIIERALEWLHANKHIPGFRFASPVNAHLEIVHSIDAAREMIEADESVAMVIYHDVDEDERDDLARECAPREIQACFTVNAPRCTGDEKISFSLTPRSERKDVVRAHQISGETLTDPIADDDEETGKRVGELIAVLALGVMEHYWRLNPPERLFKIEEPPPPRPGDETA